jgi:hypothetical protein
MLGWAHHLLCSLAFTVAVASSPMPNRAAGYDLKVGDATYAVTPGQPFTITTPGGEKLEAVLVPREFLRFEEHGISFNYPRDQKVTTETEEGVVSVTVEGVASPLVIVQAYPPLVSVAEVRKLATAEFIKEFKANGGRFAHAGKPVQRSIGGVNRAGTVLEFTLLGQKNRMEVYAFSHGGATRAVFLQHDLEDAAAAKKLFAVIADSLQ